MKRSNCFILITVLYLLSLQAWPNLMAVDDVLILKNGDRITGEIKKLERGNVHIDADYGDNIFIIEWEKVDRVESEQKFVIQTSEGSRFGGPVQTDPNKPSRILIEDSGQTIPLEQEEVVSIKPVDEGFWGRFSTSIDFGLSLTKANENKQINTRASASYLTENWALDGNINSLFNSQKEAPRTRRNEITTNYRNFLTRRWFGLAFGSFLQSDELFLDLRSTTGGGVGRYFVQTNKWSFALLGGGAYTNENYFDDIDPELGKSDQNSGEAFAGVELNGFNLGDLSIVSQFVAFPSLTQSGRIRMNFNTDFKWDLPKDLYFSVGFSNNFDSSPPKDNPKNDYVFSTSVGWSH